MSINAADVFGNATDLIPEPSVMGTQKGIGSVIKEGVDHMGDFLMSCLDGAMSRLTGLAAAGLGGVSFAGAASYAGRSEDPGFEPRLAAPTPITLAAAKSVVPPSMEQCIAHSRSEYDVDKCILGGITPTTIAYAPPVRERGESITL